MNKIINNTKVERKDDKFEGCPMCDNKIGFAFGTCVSCGYNHISGDFTFVKVHVDELPNNVKRKLVNKHGRRYNKNYESYIGIPSHNDYDGY